jgi:hypothetical protein
MTFESFRSLNPILFPVANKGGPFNAGRSGDVCVTHTGLVELKGMLQAGIVLGILGSATMILALLFG